MSRIDNSLKNIKYSLLAQAFNFIVVFVSRRVFVLVLSTEYLGLNGVFSNILSMLTIAELGIGSAVAFCLYKPLYDSDNDKINAIMLFYKKAYVTIGTIVFVIGASLTPFLDVFVEEMPDLPHIRLIYLLFVTNSALSYFFVYKRTLLEADQNKYILSLIHQATVFLMNAVQIILLLVTHNYFAYLFVMIACTVLENVITTLIVNKRYPDIKSKNARKLTKEEHDEIMQNIRAMMLHRVGGVVVNGTDNLIMAKFVSVISVGLYSNYFLVKNTLITVSVSAFQSITASIGNLGADKSDFQKKYEVFSTLNFIGAWLFGFMSVCLLVLYNPFISLWFGNSFLLDYKTVVFIVINFYILGMRQPVLTTRDAYGIFKNDRYKSVFESIINIATSIPLAIKMGVSGVLLGTIISTVTTSLWVEPYVLYKHGFQKKVYSYFIKYFTYTFVSFSAFVLTYFLTSLINLNSSVISFIIRALICAVVPNLIFLLCYFRTAEFKTVLKILKNKLHISK